MIVQGLGLCCSVMVVSAIVFVFFTFVDWSLAEGVFIVVFAVGVVACLFGAFLIYYRRRKERIASTLQSLNMKSPMVLIVCIAVYENAPEAPEFSGYVPDLDGVHHDLQSTLRLFGRLKYECFPKYNIEHPKLMWTKDELEALLTERAAALEESLCSDSESKYDGLICIVASHGMERQIITVCNSFVCDAVYLSYSMFVGAGTCSLTTS